MLTRKRARRDGGFTLVELIVSIGILSFIFATMLAVFFGALKNNRESANRLRQTRDEQFIASYLANDIQSAIIVSRNTTARCGTGTAFLEIEGRTFDITSQESKVTITSYVFATTSSPAGTVGSVDRRVCEALQSPPPTYPLTPSQTVSVAAQLSSAAPTVACLDVAGATAACDANTVTVAVSFQRFTSGDDFTIRGSRRIMS